MMMRRFAVVLLLVLSACEPDATPFPVDIPVTPTATIAANAASSVAAVPIRYALVASEAVADFDAIAASAQVELLEGTVDSALLGTQYDVIASYGDIPGWTLSPVTVHVALLLNTTTAPLNVAELAGVVQRAIDTQTVVSALNIAGATPVTREFVNGRILRVELANMGFLDGFSLNGVTVHAPGAAEVMELLRSAGIESRWMSVDSNRLMPAFEAGYVHLALATWTNEQEHSGWAALVGETNVLDLYSLPVSYLAVDGLTITFAPGGFPIASR